MPDHQQLESLISLRENRIALVDKLISKQMSFFAAADAEQRDLTAEESQRLDQLHAEVSAHQAKIGELTAEIEARTPKGRRTDPDPLPGAAPYSSAHRLSGASAVGGSFSQRLFAKSGRQQERTSFRSFAEFAHVIASGRSHPELYNAGGMSEAVGQDGGFVVPAKYSAQLFDLMSEQSLFLQRATVIPFAGASSVNFPVFDDEVRTSGGAAGLRGNWVAEGATLSKQKAKLRNVTLVAKKLAILVPVTYELLSDALPGTDARILNALATAAARDLDYACFNGTGVGMPLGVVASNAKIEIAKESGQTAATFVWANAVNMAGRVSPSAFARASWYVHPSVVPQLVGMTITFKDGATALNGELVPTMGADGGLSLLTRPVVISEACQPLGTAGDVVLGDLGQYVVALRESVRLDRDTSIYFDSDEVALRLRLRADGQPTASQPQAPRTGGATNAPFITLATRA